MDPVRSVLKYSYLNGQAYASRFIDENGIVCIKDDSHPYLKQCVAKSLPEFLSHSHVNFK